MNWLDKLERKFGRYAIPNLTVYLLAGYVIGFAVYYLAPNLLRYLTLEPYYSQLFIPEQQARTPIIVICIHSLFHFFISHLSFRFNISLTSLRISSMAVECTLGSLVSTLSAASFNLSGL